MRFSRFAHRVVGRGGRHGLGVARLLLCVSTASASARRIPRARGLAAAKSTTSKTAPKKTSQTAAKPKTASSPPNGPSTRRTRCPARFCPQSGSSPSMEIHSRSVWASSASWRRRRDAREARSRGGRVERGRSRDSGAAGAALDRRRGAEHARHGGQVPHAHGQRADREGLWVGEDRRTRSSSSTCRWVRERCRRNCRGCVPFLSRPDVHSAIDPEFSMKHNDVPGTRIGTFNAEDVNYASAAAGPRDDSSISRRRSSSSTDSRATCSRGTNASRSIRASRS